MGISIWRCGFFETIEGKWTPGDQDLENVQLFFVNNHSELCDSVAFMDSIRSHFLKDAKELGFDKRLRFKDAYKKLVNRDKVKFVLESTP